MLLLQCSVSSTDLTFLNFPLKTPKYPAGGMARLLVLTDKNGLSVEEKRYKYLPHKILQYLCDREWSQFAHDTLNNENTLQYVKHFTFEKVAAWTQPKAQVQICSSLSAAPQTDRSHTSTSVSFIYNLSSPRMCSLWVWPSHIIYESSTGPFVVKGI